jgi:fructose-specific phosphotransferase system IIC component
MFWKKWAIWYKGAIIGFIVGLILSIGLLKDMVIWSSIARPGLITCNILSQCSQCIQCKVIGFIFNLIYGFVIGAFVGWLIGKSRKVKSVKNNTKMRKRK